MVRAFGSLLGLALLGACVAGPQPGRAVFDVRSFGASGRRGDDARPALQRALDACAAAGGGTVWFPPGEYTSGSLELRSHVRVWLEAGATLYSAKGRAAFPSEALFHGQDLENIALEGHGTLDGCAEYEWREHDHDDRYIYPNLVSLRATGKAPLRSYPKADSVGNLVRLVRCKDVRIRDLSFVRSPSWNLHLWGCEGVVIEGVDIRSSLREGVWADGIDPDGCRDVRIANCTIETGDDALVFYSTSLFGPARPCEDITVTNCRLSSSSSALKFGDGNSNCIRRVTIDNCTLSNSNRGIAFMVYDGGTVSDVVLSNLVIDCTRRDWFWWGDGDPLYFDVRRRSDLDERLRSPEEPPAGSIRNVLIHNVFARGMGTSVLAGHPTSPLENITIDGLELHLASDPAAPYERAQHALVLRNAREIELRNVTVAWETPAASTWKGALAAEDVRALRLERFAAGPAPTRGPEPVLTLTNVVDVLLTGCRAQSGTGEFVRLSGAGSRDVQLLGNDLRCARTPWVVDGDVESPIALRSAGDLLPEP